MTKIFSDMFECDPTGSAWEVGYAHLNDAIGRRVISLVRNSPIVLALTHGIVLMVGD